MTGSEIKKNSKEFWDRERIKTNKIMMEFKVRASKVALRLFGGLKDIYPDKERVDG